MTREEKFMNDAIALSKKAIEENEGGPFGCIIVKDNKIIGKGNNKVILENDPTAHAEVVAIRDACKNLGSFQLEGCEIYTSCEPCPMCLGAIYWARPAKVYYAPPRNAATSIGFADSFIYDEFAVDHAHRKIPIINVGRKDAFEIFKMWIAIDNKTLY